jgi:hypothetical protein
MTDFPRRARLDKFTPAERAIWDATQAVEAMPADTRLTEAVILLGKARDLVADYVDATPAPEQVEAIKNVLMTRGPEWIDGEGELTTDAFARAIYDAMRKA